MNIRATNLAALTLTIGLAIALVLFVLQDRGTDDDIRKLTQTITTLINEVRESKTDIQKLQKSVMKKDTLQFDASAQSTQIDDLTCKGITDCSPANIAVRFCQTINYKSGRAMQAQGAAPNISVKKVICFN